MKACKNKIMVVGKEGFVAWVDSVRIGSLRGEYRVSLGHGPYFGLGSLERLRQRPLLLRKKGLLNLD